MFATLGPYLIDLYSGHSPVDSLADGWEMVITGEPGKHAGDGRARTDPGVSSPRLSWEWQINFHTVFNACIGSAKKFAWVCMTSYGEIWMNFLANPLFLLLPHGSDGKESACNVGDLGLIPGLGRSPGGGHGNPLQYCSLKNPHGQRSPVGYSPWGLKESDTTEWLSTAHSVAKPALSSYKQHLRESLPLNPHQHFAT